MASRCETYLWHDDVSPQITISAENYRRELYPASWTEDMIAYMESAYQFYRQLVLFDGLFLHSSAVVLDGRAYLFSGHSGAGKSTHTRLWQGVFGPAACVINDDKPALRRVDGRWMVYGTPWCGKDGINENAAAPLAGICYLKKAKKNEIRRLSSREAMAQILAQTIYKFPDRDHLNKLFDLMNMLLQEIPVFELENLPEPDAARLSYKTMYDAMKEAGL